MRTHRSLRLLAAAMLAVLLAACSGGGEAATTTTLQTEAGESAPTETAQTDETESEDHDMGMATDEPETTAGAPTVDTPAATLTRDLTGLLMDHEYLAGAAVYMGVKAGGDLEDPGFVAAAKALDNNSVQLSETVASVYGDAGGEQFLSLWRAHIGFFVDYTLGKATGDKAAARTASRKLDGYRADFGAFIDGATEGTLPADAVADALTPHVDATKAAIDSVVAGDGKAFDKLREAASHMPMIATALAGGIASHQGLEGAADSAASGLQRDLTAGLAEHEYLAGMAVLTAVQAGGDLEDPTFKAAAAALDANSVALSEAIGSVYGDAGGEQFLSLWRTHIGFFVDYTLGQATGDKKVVAKAEKQLDGYRSDFGAFLEGATEGGLPQDAVAEALTPHVDATKAAIDAVVTGKGNGFDELRKAAGHMPMIATAISGAIVAQFPDQFAS